jgi:hypothetical protein
LHRYLPRAPWCRGCSPPPKNGPMPNSLRCAFACRWYLRGC